MATQIIQKMWLRKRPTNMLYSSSIFRELSMLNICTAHSNYKNEWYSAGQSDPGEHGRTHQARVGHAHNTTPATGPSPTCKKMKVLNTMPLIRSEFCCFQSSQPCCVLSQAAHAASRSEQLLLPEGQYHCASGCHRSQLPGLVLLSAHMGWPA